MKFEPTLESVRQHQVPDWFHDAKLGVMVTWGLYSVPGWAPLSGDLTDIVAKEGWPAQFIKNPYAEWYLNTLRIEGSPTHRFHVQTYGENFPYDNFAPMFNEAIKQWQPDTWSSLFQKAQMHYVVLITKHCDTFLPWPSAHPTRRKPGKFYASRDIVGELTESVRRAGLKMGLYYCGGMDWVYNPKVLRDFPDVFSSTPQEPEYVEYVNAHWHELIDHYKPSIMWNDIGYPVAANAAELFAYYYNTVPDGVINDRFGQVLVQDKLPEEGVLTNPAGLHWDFKTPEYTAYNRIIEYKWECVRGIGHSFGYNRNEGPEEYIAVDKLIPMFVDIVSKNGNLLLGVGPMADGTIPDLQQDRLLGLGAWLDVNGDAIFGTRPWKTAEGRASGRIDVRFTQKGDALYAILLGTPSDETVTLENLHAADNTTVNLLGYPRALDWRQSGDHFAATLPPHVKPAPAHALRISPQPRLVK
jgi:alpha-L-fucosidase